MAIRKSSSSGIPFGNNSGRPASPNSGQPYFNGETARLELYTSNGAWENIVQEVPGVSSISGQYLETNNSNTLTIIGTNFVSGATAYAIGTNAVEVAATSTTFNSLVQLTAVFTGLTAANEPYDIKVVNPSNLFGLLPDALFVNNQVVWTTASGSLGSFGDAVAISVSATASDDSTITYAVAAGSSLPSGVNLNTATGLISGTLPDVASNTTYTFTLTASDGSNPAVSRQFSFTSNAAPIWSTSSGSLGEFSENTSINITITATDASDSVSYSLASGSSLPSGITLNSSTGVISGTLPSVSQNTTYTFTINASDGVNTVSREFSITANNVVLVEYLVVGGGGSGATNQYHGGGGGAGGFRTGSTGLAFAVPHTVAVGLGAVGWSNTGSTSADGRDGNPSTLSSITAAGGGGAGGYVVGNGRPGGSGGGSGAYGDGSLVGGTATPSGQGNNGGKYNGAGGNKTGGGGGGAGAPGSDSGNGTGGHGGAGLPSSITGTQVYYAGGGGGSTESGTTTNGGIGGGGAGGTSNGTSGTPNTGGGGGSGERNGTSSGGGGSGVVIIAYPNTEPAITVSGGLTYDQPTRAGYRVYRFTAGTGTITF